jgi:hypothetical protein
MLRSTLDTLLNENVGVPVSCRLLFVLVLLAMIGDESGTLRSRGI